MIKGHLGLGSKPPKRVGPGKGSHIDCVTCQNPSKGDMDGILEFVNDNKDKT